MIFNLSTRRAIFAAIVLLPLAINAQANAEDPQNPQAATASAPYKSVFSDYKSYQDPAVQSWRKSNADVAQPGTQTHSGMGNMEEKSVDAAKQKQHEPSSPSVQAPHSMPDHSSMQKH